MFTLFYFTWGVFGSKGFEVFRLSGGKKYKSGSLIGITWSYQTLTIKFLFLTKSIIR